MNPFVAVTHRIRTVVAAAALLSIVTATTVVTAGDGHTDCSGPEKDRPQVIPYDCLCELRPQDQMWLVQSECVGCGDLLEESAKRLGYWQLVKDQWQPAARPELIAAVTPEAVTILVVHGNRTDEATAVQMTWDVYSRAVVAAGDRPLRMVVWSWPSEKIRGRPMTDFVIKAARSDLIGYHVGWLLRQFDKNAPVSLVGFSYGARVITSALHGLGGGEIQGQSFSGPVIKRKTPFRAVLIAAGLHDYWLSPGQHHGRAMSQVDRMVVTTDPCDWILKRYHRLDCGCPQALGLWGLSGSEQLGAELAKVRQVDVSDDVGRDHKWSVYICALGVVEAIQQDALFQGARFDTVGASALNLAPVTAALVWLPLLFQ
jgi:hypothetical protein